MTEYFINHIDKCLKLNLPIMLYHHPLDKNHEVLQNIFDYIKEKAIPNISYDDYFNFWMARMNSKLNLISINKIIFSKSNLIQILFLCFLR